VIADEVRGRLNLPQGFPPLLTLRELQDEARARLEPDIYADVAGGGGAEVTMRANEAAWERVGVAPRILRDVSTTTSSLDLLGAPLSTPIVVAPGGRQRRLHPDGEVATAKGAERAGSLMVLSTFATTSIEDLHEAVPSCRRWFQLYLTVDRGWSQALVQRASDSGFEAVVLTVDAPVAGLRLRSLRHPALARDNLSFANFGASERLDDASTTTAGGGFDAGLTMDDLSWLVDISPLPVLVKGVLRADDARECVKRGAAGVVVSNHGGRQMDCVTPSAIALRRVVAEVGGEVPVLVDGGIRTGSSVLKALALGATAVLVGRPALWGLALAGEDGVYAVLRYLTTELWRSMQLCGATSLKELNSTLLDLDSETMALLVP
jgi:4-hydroxymandelate oxidase